VLVLLPPSETKRDGGAGGPLDYSALAYPKLNPKRRMLVRSLRTLARDTDASVTALKLGGTQLAEIARNRAVATSATMPVMDRYTGVLYDALDAPTLDVAQREFAARHVLVHSALFGPVSAADPIPAYRLSHDSRLPGLPLKAHWADAIRAALAPTVGVVLDLRSEAYVALGAVPAGPQTVFVRVVAETGDGRRRALNHFNKKSKGEFTRALLQYGEDFGTVAALCDWANGSGFRLQPGAPGELDLVVDEVVAGKVQA
jgi:cytoplasmic iron level regulating protein YaaA (DUF328/UPF0246 family)